MQRILQPGEIEALDRVSFPRVRPPQLATLFQERAARLEQLAKGNPIADYLRFAARLVRAQHALAQKAAPVAEPSGEAVRLAGENGMPLLPASEPLPEGWQATLRELLEMLNADEAVPAVLKPGILGLGKKDDATLDTLARQLLSDNVAREDIATAPLLMGGLQLVFAMRAAAVDPRQAPYTEPASICPVCGSAPVASVLRIGGNVAGHRYLHCGLCACEWHMVRVKCSHCESTKSVRYQGAEDANGKIGDVVQAETCGECQTYRKIVNQEKDPYAEPLADDLASLTLDLLMGDTEFLRASGNPLLIIEKPLVN